MSKVLVTFSAPHIFLSSDQWTQIRGAIAEQCPLRDISWKPSSRPATRTIQELDIELVGLDTIREEHASQIPQTLLEKPFLNLYIVTCEDNDTYKNTVRRQIKDWHTIASQRKNQEWLILLVVRPDARTTQGSFFALKSNVLDKIKADFNSDRKDRCVQLVWSQGAITPPASADLTNKMKEGIISAFDSAVVQRSEEVKRSESQRQMPGWNFCTFFILKESLASSFVGMSLPDDAILTYSELEASFLQTQASSLSGQKTISWFGKLINPDPEDDSLPLLDIRKKPYRDLILNNTISVFDFRVYLLAKHCEVLGMSGRVSEMARKAASFLGGFGQRLNESDASLSKFFVESWIYSAALNVVDECDKWAELFQLDTATSASFSAVKGELLELARIQLDKIGINVSHLPPSPPFSMSLPTTVSEDSEPSTPTTPSVGRITRADLLVALTDREMFDKLYVETTNRAIDMYIKGGRRKFALKLHGSLAALDLHRMRYAQAHQTYTSLPAHYMPHSWTSLATFMLGRRLETHMLLDKAHNREWVETVLAFLKGFVEEALHGEMNAQQLLGGGDICEYIGNMITGVRESALENDVVTTDHPMLSIEIIREIARLAEDEDGSYLDIRVRNALPCDIMVDSIRLFLSGRDSEQLVFTASTQTFSPGPNTISLFCPNAVSGMFILDVSEVSISSVRLQWNHQLPTRQKQPTVGNKRSFLVRIPRDVKAADIQIEPPRLIQLDASQSVLLTLSSRRNRIVHGVIKLSSPAGVEFRTREAEVKEADGASVECNEEGIQVANMEQGSEVQVRVPHAYHAAAEVLKVIVQLEYRTSDAESCITRHTRFTRHVTTSLPLMIQAHDHFRGKSLISKFTISTSPGTYQHLRISSVNMESVDDEQGGLVVKGCRSIKRGVVTVTPTQPANFLFRIDSETPRSGYASVHLHISYRLLREEVESLVKDCTSAVLRKQSLPTSLTSDVTERILKALESDGTWLERYNTTRELRVPQDSTDVSGDVDGVSGREIETVINDTIATLGSNSPSSLEEGEWRQVIVPVDLPFKNIVTAARILIHFPSSPSGSKPEPRSRHSPLFAGQPVAATLSIGASFHWSGPGAHGKSYAMRFEVKEIGRDWLISGRKKGDFLAMDGVTHSVPLTLIPLHHGELALPQVIVHPLPLTSGEMTMGSMALPSAESHQIHGAEQVLVLPRGGRTTFVVGMGGE